MNQKYYLELSSLDENLTLLVEDRFKDEYPGLITLEGPWGSGKSAFLNNFIFKHPTTNSIRNIYFVYNAWENNDYANPLMPVLLSICTQLENMTKLKGALDAAVRVALQALCESLLQAVDALATIDPRLAAPVKIVQRLFLFGKSVRKEYEKNKISNNALFSSVKNYTDLYFSISKAINQVQCPEMRLILIIDDIDRCLPEKQIELLESLHHVSDHAKLLTIISINPTALSQTITNYYGSTIDPQSFLDKLRNGRIDISSAVCQQICERAVNELFTDDSKPKTGQNSPYCSQVALVIGKWCEAKRDMSVRQAKQFEQTLSSVKNFEVPDGINYAHAQASVALISLVYILDKTVLNTIFKNVANFLSTAYPGDPNSAAFRALFQHVDDIDSFIVLSDENTQHKTSPLQEPLDNFPKFCHKVSLEGKPKNISLLRLIELVSFSQLDAQIGQAPYHE